MNPAALVVGLTTLISWGLMDQSRKSGWMLVPYRVRHHGEVHRVLSHAFVHADWMHLLFNMYVLYEFGQTVAVELAGTALGGFWGLYLAGIIGGAIPSLRRHGDNPRYASLGASGATSAVLMAFVAMHPTHTLLLFFVIPIPAVLAGVLFFWYEGRMHQHGGTRIAHDAHVGGGIVGLLWSFVFVPDSLVNAWRALSSLLP